jgi:probable HAF family extracellular repeat protein
MRSNNCYGSRAAPARGFMALWVMLAMGVGLLASSAATVPSTPVHAQSFSGLGFLPGGPFSRAQGVNADGTVVVGFGDAATGIVNEAFRWTQAGGMVGLGFLPGGNLSSAFGVNADGTVVVGIGNEAFRWTQAGGMAGLGFLPGGSGSEARAVNADGTVVVGGNPVQVSLTIGGNSGTTSVKADIDH